MKKVILAMYYLSPVFFANAEEVSSKIGFYCGVSLDETLSSSEYKMDFSMSPENFEGCGGVVRYKNDSTKLGYGVFLGCAGGSDFYCAAEVGVLFSNFSLNKTFSDYEALETPRLERRGSP
ncbi:MAG: hypothetical protein LBB29_00445 [Holosporaceae bacterium]|jgi:hypothetical protein|nr:hypothetical protein [Holosporaceae bacterium]